MKPFNDTYVMYQLLEFIDESSIICLCKASKKLNEICKQYIELEDERRFEINISISRWENSECLAKYCKNNDIIKIRKIIKIDLLQLNYAFYCVCQTGHMATVQLMIKKGARDWNWGLKCACQYNHIDIVKLMIEKGAFECYSCDKSMEEHLKKK